jgi:glycosyltransferase involved in cell wall biosynthesis
MMRILLANEAREGGGGVETYLATTAAGLAARGHDVALLYGNTAAETGPTRIDVAPSWSVADLGLERALTQVRGWAPDIAYSHNMRRLDVDEALARQGPLVKLMHGYFGTCVSGQKAFLFPAARPCTRLCGPACLALYVPRRCGQLNVLEIMPNYRWASRQRALFPQYRSIVVASRHMRDQYLAHGVSGDRVHTIPLFAGPSTSPVRTTAAPVDIVFLGRLTTLKGPGLLLESARAASAVLGRTVSVTLAGEGPEREPLRRAAESLPGVNAVFPGWVDVQARAELLSRGTLLAVPSIWPEPFGLVGLEAAALGVPAVAFDTGGISEWLTNGVNGRLVTPVGDSAAMGAAIAAILVDPSTRVRLSEGARATAARLSMDAHLSRLEAVLEAARAS